MNVQRRWGVREHGRVGQQLGPSEAKLEVVRVSDMAFAKSNSRYAATLSVCAHGTSVLDHVLDDVARVVAHAGEHR